MAGNGRSGGRTLLVGGLAVLVLASAAAIGYRWRYAREVPVLGPESATLVPGVHLLCGIGPSSAYAIETSDGIVLIDSGLEGDAQPLKDQMVKLGLDWRSVKAVLITHVHGDHCGGAEHLREVAGAKVHIGKGDAAPLKAGGPWDAFFSTFVMPARYAPHPTKVDVELSGDEVLSFGDTSIRVLATPGHTPGSTCYLLERDGLRLLFTGDVIMHLGGKDVGGVYSPYLAPRYRGDAATYLATLRTLRAMPRPDLVLPGHPGDDVPPHSPHLSREQWEDMLDQSIREMETLLARYRDDGPDFLDDNPKELLPGLVYLGEFQGVSVYGLFVEKKFILVNAPGGPGLVEFLRERLKVLGRQPVEPTAVLLTSCNPKEAGGLRDVIEKSHAQVVANPAGWPALKAAVPPDTVFVSPETWLSKGGLPMTPIPLRGRGLGPMAYSVPWAGKTVLFTGGIPVKPDPTPIQGLMSDLSGSRDDAMDYLDSVNRLEALRPNLWLPSVPSNGQNANLYGDEWMEIIKYNYRGPYSLLNRG